MRQLVLFVIAIFFSGPAFADIYYSCSAPNDEPQIFTIDGRTRTITQWDGQDSWVLLCDYAKNTVGNDIQCRSSVTADESATAAILATADDGTPFQLDFNIDRRTGHLTLKHNGKLVKDDQCSLSPGDSSMANVGIYVEPGPNSGTKVTVENQTQYPLRCSVELEGSSDTLGTTRKVIESTVLTVQPNASNYQGWANIASGTAQAKTSCEITG